MLYKTGLKFRNCEKIDFRKENKFLKILMLKIKNLNSEQCKTINEKI